MLHYGNSTSVQSKKDLSEIWCQCSCSGCNSVSYHRGHIDTSPLPHIADEYKYRLHRNKNWKYNSWSLTRSQCCCTINTLKSPVVTFQEARKDTIWKQHAWACLGVYLDVFELPSFGYGSYRSGLKVYNVTFDQASYDEYAIYARLGIRTRRSQQKVE